MTTPANLFTDAMPPAVGERFDTLLAHGRVGIERIVSSSQPDQTEYRQTQDEWVVLLQGEAELIVNGESVPLQAGQHLFIAAGMPHTVKRTSHGAMWLAVHIHPDAATSTAITQGEGPCHSSPSPCASPSQASSRARC